jgi:hypothetical protein
MSTLQRRVLGILLAIVPLAPAGLQAQIPGGGANPASGFNASIMALFGGHKQFSGKVELRVTDGKGSEVMSMPSSYIVSNGKIRQESDMTLAKMAMLQPQMIQQMKALGLDRTVALVRPDKKTLSMLYPGLKSWVEMPLPENSSAPPESFKMEKSDQGKETIDGHPCTKEKVVITDAGGKKTTATVWNATDLKGFPVQVEYSESGNTIRELWKDIKFTAPDDKQFEPPFDYQKYDSVPALMQSAMQRVLGAPGKK